jgi:osmoprotectant transport system substrate-binding protein
MESISCKALYGAAASALMALALAGQTAGCGAKSSHTPSAATGATTQSTTTSSLPGSGRPPVTVGDKNTPEQFVLGELYEQALAARGFSVSLNRNIGPTGVTIRALHQGSLDLYPEYIYIWNQDVARDAAAFKSLRTAYRAGQQYALAHGLELLKPTPFGNTPAIVVTDYFARTHGLKQIGDLGPFSSALAFGGPPQFRSTGLAALERVYNLPAPIYRVLSVGGQYDALDTGEVQAAEVNLTDGSLATGDYRVLADPKRVLGWGNVVPVVTQKVLNAEGPAFTATINAVSALLTLPVMRELNEQVDQHADPGAVATQFLETHGLIPTGQGSS